MISIKIAELRSHLSAYLKKVRSGEEVIIADRHTPIGRIIPYSSNNNFENFELIPPVKGYKGFTSITIPPLSQKTKPFMVEDLISERRKR